MKPNNLKKSRVPLYSVIPNVITILALCLGLTSVRYAMDSKFIIATSLILVAAIMDSLDGRIARMLNCSSNFGAQLDSLADIVSFGVSPCLLVYMWSLHSIPYKGVGWTVVLFYITCSALRLARFNTQQSDPEKAEISKYFFTGVPIPAAAALILMPMGFTFQLTDWVMPNWMVCIYMVIVGCLMVSTIPTFAYKKMSVEREYIPFILVASGLLIAGILLEPWVVLPLLGVAYLIAIPCSIIQHRRMLSK